MSSVDFDNGRGELLPFPLDTDDREAQRNYVRLLCAVTGLDTSNLAKVAGKVPSTLNKFMNPQRPVKHNLSAKTLGSIRRAAIRELHGKFGDDPERIIAHVNHVLATRVSNDTKEGAPRGGRNSASLFQPEPQDFRRPLPHSDLNRISICAVEEGRLVDIGGTRRPRSLENVKGGYAIYMPGTHMRPRYNPGWLLYINPHKPPIQGRDVVVYRRDGSFAIGQFDREELNGDVVIRWGVDEKAPEVLIVHTDLDKIHLIVGADQE